MARAKGFRVVRWELIIPAVTTIVALIIGAEINSIEARRLERQKFQFEVLKFTFSAKDRSERLRMLCDFSTLGFIDDVDRKYARAEIDGRRPCADPLGAATHQPSNAYRELVSEIGDSSTGELSFERGFLKLGGGVAPYLDLSNVPAPARPVTQIKFVSLVSDVPAWTKEVALADNMASTAHIIVGADGRIVQLRNIGDRGDQAPVVIALQNAGELTFDSASRGPMFALKDKFGNIVPRDRGVGFVSGSDTKGRSRFTGPQLSAAAGIAHALCLSWPNATIELQPYVADTLRMQEAAPFSRSACQPTP